MCWTKLSNPLTKLVLSIFAPSGFWWQQDVSVYHIMTSKQHKDDTFSLVFNCLMWNELLCCCAPFYRSCHEDDVYHCQDCMNMHMCSEWSSISLGWCCKGSECHIHSNEKKLYHLTHSDLGLVDTMLSEACKKVVNRTWCHSE